MVGKRLCKRHATVPRVVPQMLNGRVVQSVQNDCAHPVVPQMLNA
jgi:hypothetical protein